MLRALQEPLSEISGAFWKPPILVSSQSEEVIFDTLSPWFSRNSDSNFNLRALKVGMEEGVADRRGSQFAVTSFLDHTPSSAASRGPPQISGNGENRNGV